MSNEQERVYVLRLNAEKPDAGQTISLYDADRGERVYFHSLSGLLEHLQRQLGPESDLPDDPHLQS
ncbi:hypothetical protein [Deinococcus sp. UYEF24]